MLIQLEDFQDAKNQIFTVTHGEEKVELTLKDVKVKTEYVPKGYESFSLFFHDSKDDELLPQGTYDMQHEGRNIKIFIVPFGEDNGIFGYQAVFNRKIGPTQEDEDDE